MVTNTLTTPAPISFKWWHALIIFLVANGLGSLSTLSFTGDFEFYNNLVQPNLAPPDWLFPVAWLINNIAALVALYYVANSKLPKANKITFYWSEGCFWMLFSSFGFMFFYLESAFLGAVNTFVSFVITIVSIAAVRRHHRAWILLLPRFLWLCLAVYVSAYVAGANEDALFQFGPWW